MTLSAWVLGLVVFASVVLAALLVLPVTVQARGHISEEQIWGQVRAIWAWGLASACLSPEGREVRFFGLALPYWRNGRPAPRPGKPKNRPRRGPRWAEVLEHLPILLSAVRRFLSTLHVRWTLQGRAGLDDPADTALAAALVRQFALALPKPVRIAIEPEYLEPALRLRSTLVVRLWLGELFFVAPRQLARREVRQALRALRS